VAEDPILRQTPHESALEGIDLVDSLANKGSFAEQVLIDV